MKYALINGILLDGTETMEPQTGLTILTNGDRIETIVPAEEVHSGYETVDLAGRYVMPGLINLHVHLPASGKPTMKQKDAKKTVRTMTSNALLRSILFKLCAGYAKTELMSGVTTLRTVGGVQATEDSVKNGSYVVQRPFVLVTKDGTELSPAAQAFFDYATSAEAAPIIAAAGAVAVNG